ncbi:hypothetical protein AB48_1233 [Escherichia coli 3-475-03_S1_C2]|nr:hypothetical protein AB48_1233 [Escherichia coli 3-475-03_S1_C2]
MNGLSPLARGTRLYFVHLLLFFRFIPAGAGNTPVATPRVKTPPVYPRWRGEHGNGAQ